MCVAIISLWFSSNVNIRMILENHKKEKRFKHFDLGGKSIHVVLQWALSVLYS